MDFQLLFNTENSTIEVIAEGETAEEYPEYNPLPPFWRTFETITKFYEDNLAFRGSVLETFISHKMTYKEYQKEIRVEGVIGIVGDKSSFKTNVFICGGKCAEEDEKEVFDSLKAEDENAEALFIGAKVHPFPGKRKFLVFLWLLLDF